MAIHASRRPKKRQSASSLHDTIEVKQRLSTITISEISDPLPDDSAMVKHAYSTRDRYLPAEGPNRPWGRKGKAPMKDDTEEHLPVDDDELVEEYEFTSDDAAGEVDDDEFGNDDRSVISLSSEASEHPVRGLADRPWKDFNDQMREQWERMYAEMTTHAVNGNWEVTEEYQREKDTEMLRYMEDYPIAQWIIPMDHAEQAYSRLLERSRWRALGIRIYDGGRIPEWVPGGTSAIRPQQMPNVLQDRMPHRELVDENLAARPPVHNLLGPQSRHLPPQNMQTHVSAARPPPGPDTTNGISDYSPQAHLYGQPGPLHLPPGISRPIGLPQHIPYGVPEGYQGFYSTSAMSMPESTNPRKARVKKDTPPPVTPPPPPPTPPYATRERPVERKAPSKSGRRTIRKAAEAEEFPWCRQLNFHEVKARASWDDSIYDPATIQAMEAIRAHNMPIIEEIDQRIQEQQREYRVNRTARKKGEASTDVEPAKERKKKEPRMRNDAGGDPYHSGCFTFASIADERKAASINRASPDDVINDAEAGRLDVEAVADIKITWNPGKKGQTHELLQAEFSVKDTVLTRQQLEKTPVLTRRAAECIIDFCPDMLWRSMLLRITSEAGYGNKDVRDRFCYNGCYCDKATITKRISAALGQKQTQPKAKGVVVDEWEWYDENVKDFTKYIEYFGKRTSHRNMLKIQIAGEKRRMKAAAQQDQGNDELSDEVKVAKKKRRVKADATNDREADEMREAEGGEDDEAEGSDDHEDAVSMQDSEILDNVDDD